MKNMILVAIILLTGAGPALAQEATPKIRAAADEVSAQVNITRDAVEQMLRTLGEQKQEHVFKAQDYREQQAEFKQGVARVMEQFQAALKDSILKKLAFWMDRYNQIVVSKQFDQSQKEILLKQQMDQLRSQLNLLSEEYHREIRKVYGLLGSTPASFEAWFAPTKFIRKRFKGCPGDFRDGNYNVRLIAVGGNFADVENLCANSTVVGYEYTRYGVLLPDGDSTWFNRELGLSEAFLKITRGYYRKSVFPFIAGGCRSQVCLGLRAGDLSLLAGLIKSTIDRDIVVELANSTQVRIEALDQRIDIMSSFLTRTDYPQIVQSWPFDTP